MRGEEIKQNYGTFRVHVILERVCTVSDCITHITITTVKVVNLKL